MDLTMGNLSKQIYRVGIPAAVGLFFTTLYNLIDTYFAGYINESALTSISIIFPLFIVITSVSSGMGQAVGSLFGNALGSKDYKYARQVAYVGLLISMAIGIVLLILGIIFSRTLISFLTDSQEITDYAVTYINILFLFNFTFIIPGILSTILSALGDTKTYRNALIIGTVANIILDYLFVVYLDLNTAGIALSTVLIQFVQMLYLIYKIKRKDIYKDHKILDYASFKLHICVDVLKQGIAPMLSTMMFAVGIFIYNYFVSYVGGDSALAGFGVAYKIEQILLIPIMGIGVATLAIVSQNNGADNLSRINQTIKTTLVLTILIAVVGELLMYAFIEPLMMLFTQDKDALAYGKLYITIELFIIPFYSVMTISQNALQAIKHPNINFVVTVFRQIIMPPLLFSLVIYLFGSHLSLIFITMGIINIFAIMTMYFILRRILNKKKLNISS